MAENLKVFISYSHSDTELVKKIEVELNRLRIPYFRDKKDIPWGEPITSGVEGAIKTCSHLLVVVSPGSRKSEWVPYEIGVAQGSGITILPFLTHPELDTFTFTRDLVYMTSLEDVKDALHQLASKHRPQFPENPKPYAVGDVVVDDVYLMYGNHTKTFEISASYHHRRIDTPEELQEVYQPFLADAKQAAADSGAQFFNGPNTRLLRFTETTRQGADGLEHKGVMLELGPTSWEQYTVLNTFLNRRVSDGSTIREKFADARRLYGEDRDFSWCRLSNILALALVPVTTDGYGIIQYRNPKGVSSEGGRYTSGLAENIHRYLDESEGDDLWSRRNTLDLPREVIRRGVVDENYQPAGTPSPFLAAERGLWEELSSALPGKVDRRSYVFTNIAFELPKFHPLLLGVVELGMTRHEFERLRKACPGQDHSEFLRLEYPRLSSHDAITMGLLASPSKWVAVGRASLIMAIHYWEANHD